MKREKWTIKYLPFCEPPECDLEIVFEDSRFDSVFYSNAVLTFNGTEEDVVDLLENRLPDWRVVASNTYYPA